MNTTNRPKTLLVDDFIGTADGKLTTPAALGINVVLSSESSLNSYEDKSTGADGMPGLMLKRAFLEVGVGWDGDCWSSRFEAILAGLGFPLLVLVRETETTLSDADSSSLIATGVERPAVPRDSASSI